MKTIKVCSLAAVGALGLYLVLGGPRATAESNDPATAPKPAPVWTLSGINGQPIQSTNLLGKVVILDFWATWCPPCRKEIPNFIALQQQYGGQGLTVVGASVDEGGVPTVQAFAAKAGMNYPVGLADMKMMQDFGGVDAIPKTLVIDRQGRIVQEHVGYTEKAEFEAEIKPLLQAGAH